jgi:hypothetical protein
MMTKIVAVCVLVLLSGFLMEIANADKGHGHDDHGDININIDISGAGGANGLNGLNGLDGVDGVDGVDGLDGIDAQQLDTGCLCVSGGLSRSDVSRSLSLAMTAGAHELDYSTQDWQLSITYAQQIDEDEEGAYSVKLGKRWDRFAKTLMHATFIPEQGKDYGNWVIVGGTFRF